MAKEVPEIIELASLPIEQNATVVMAAALVVPDEPLTVEVATLRVVPEGLQHPPRPLHLLPAGVALLRRLAETAAETEGLARPGEDFTAVLARGAGLAVVLFYDRAGEPRVVACAREDGAAGFFVPPGCLHQLADMLRRAEREVLSVGHCVRGPDTIN
jgi:hypothetical protein